MGSLGHIQFLLPGAGVGVGPNTAVEAMHSGTVK